MKREILPELLAMCLADLESGRSTVEDCVAAHPAAEEELRSLLSVARAIEPMASVAPDQMFRMRGRAALIAAISSDVNPVTKSPFPRWWSRMFDSWRQHPQLLTRRMGMPAMIVVLVIALTTAGGGSFVYASQDAQPGGALYQVKTAVEELQLMLVSGDEARAETYLDLATRRVGEIQKASEAGNAAAAVLAAERFAKDVDQVDKHLTQATASGKDVTSIAGRLAANLARQREALVAAEGRVPEQAKSALAQATRAAEKGLKIARQHAGGAPAAGRSDDAQVRQAKDKAATGQPVSTPTAGALSGAPTQPTATISSTISVTFTQIVSDVEKLAADPSVPGQSYNGLLAKLRAAQAALERGQEEVAVRILDAFLGELRGLNRSGHISAENYDSLYASYRNLVSGLGGSPMDQATPNRQTPRPEHGGTTPERSEDSDRDGARPGRPDPSGRPSGPDGVRGRPDWRQQPPTTAPEPTVVPTQLPSASLAVPTPRGRR